MAMGPSEHDALHEQVELYALGALDASDRAAFEAHIGSCAECAAQLRSLSPVVEALGHAVPQHDPPSALRARVLDAVAGVRSTAPSPRPTTSGSVLFPWLAAAAALMLAAGLGLYTTTLRQRIGVLEQRLEEAIARADAGERQMADLRHTASDAQARVGVLEAPDLQRIDLSGQPPAPQASARAFWSRSRGLVFTASNLPSAPAGKTYQLWVLTKQPAPISAGLFKPDSQGRVAAVFETPLDLPQPIGMAVTIEPDGGVPAPTGDKYLVGN
ncbi:MAG TPA: anti-sigma factor [Vicinamibacterales bacterium]